MRILLAGIADLCRSKGIDFILGHALYMRAIYGVKTKNDRIDSLKIARLGGWKGYESRRHPDITTFWIGLKHFKAAFEGWQLHRNVSTR